MAHHNIHFGADWGAAFDALLKQGRLMPDPSRLVTVPSLDDATLARTLSDLGQATEAGQSPWQPLPTTAGPASGTLLIDSAVLAPLLVETGLTG